MRIPFLLCLVLSAVPAAAQDIGARTRSPQSMIADFGMAPDQDDLREALTAAAAHPLGTAQNPVRVGGPEGERAYIARLRCADGTTPRIGQRASSGVGAFGTVTEIYPLDCGAAAPGRVALVMDMYHEEHREDAAPPGFTIVPR